MSSQTEAEGTLRWRDWTLVGALSAAVHMPLSHVRAPLCVVWLLLQSVPETSKQKDACVTVHGGACSPMGWLQKDLRRAQALRSHCSTNSPSVLQLIIISSLLRLFTYSTQLKEKNKPQIRSKFKYSWKKQGQDKAHIQRHWQEIHMGLKTVLVHPHFPKHFYYCITFPNLYIFTLA